MNNLNNNYYNTYYQISKSTVQSYFDELRDWEKAEECIREFNEDSDYPLSDFCTPDKTYQRKSDITKYLKKLYFDTCGLRLEPVEIKKIGCELDKDLNDNKHILGTWIVNPREYNMWFDKALQKKETAWKKK